MHRHRQYEFGFCADRRCCDRGSRACGLHRGRIRPARASRVATSLMLGVHYFLVEPRAEAREHFTRVASEHADLLLDAMLLDPMAKSRDDIIALAKLVFLARIREYEPFSAAENALRI